jgi:hypothetical protein
MSLVETNKSAVATLRVSVVADRMKVEHVLAFADELRAQNVPLATLVDGSVNHSTMHCTGLSVRVLSDLEV